MDQNGAESMLKYRGLSVSFEMQKDNSKTKGEVIDQSVKAGEQVKRGDSIRLTVIFHDETMEVPDLSGKTKAEAEKTLKKVGLKGAFNEAYDEETESGKVISQSPKAGATVKDGSSVTVNISKGKDPAKAVPTEPVGTGYVDYTFQDVDNDGEKELIEVYQRALTAEGSITDNEAIVYRIYNTSQNYREIEFKPWAIFYNYDVIVYNGNTRKVEVWGEHAPSDADVFGYVFCDPENDNSNIISVVQNGYNPAEYYRRESGESISRSEYLNYMSNVTYLYGHRLSKSVFDKAKNYQEVTQQETTTTTQAPEPKVPEQEEKMTLITTLNYDIDNDGVKNKIEVYSGTIMHYNQTKLIYRIYSNQDSYYEKEFYTPFSNIYYDYIVSNGNNNITDVVEVEEVTHGQNYGVFIKANSFSVSYYKGLLWDNLDDADFTFEINGNKVSREEYETYVGKLKQLYSYRDPSGQYLHMIL